MRILLSSHNYYFANLITTLNKTNITMKKTYLTGLTIDSATTLGELMDNVVQYQDPHSFFLLVDIKESMIIDEEYELLRDFRKLEQLHGCDIPLPESCLK